MIGLKLRLSSRSRRRVHPPSAAARTPGGAGERDRQADERAHGEIGPGFGLDAHRRRSPPPPPAPRRASTCSAIMLISVLLRRPPPRDDPQSRLLGKMLARARNRRGGEGRRASPRHPRPTAPSTGSRRKGVAVERLRRQRAEIVVRQRARDSASSSTLPRRGRAPVLVACARPVWRSIQSSIRALPGPVSKAIRCPSRPIQVTLATPPILTHRHRPLRQPARPAPGDRLGRAARPARRRPRRPRAGRRPRRARCDCASNAPSPSCTSAAAPAACSTVGRESRRRRCLSAVRLWLLRKCATAAAWRSVSVSLDRSQAAGPRVRR